MSDETSKKEEDANAVSVEPIRDAASSPRNETSQTGVALTQARRALWRGHPSPVLNPVLDPFRTFVLDPTLAIQSVLLPLLLPRSIDSIFAKGCRNVGIPILKWLYPNTVITNRNNNKNGETSMKDATKSAIFQPTIVTVRPPSDFQSAFQGAISFVVSAIADVAGILTNPKKLTGWMQALSQFNTFLESTGVGAELEEAIQKPLLAGRLLDNFKLLNDIQEQHYGNRVELAQQDDIKSRGLGFAQDIERGHRMMRFATAAYGTEMIRSAVDQNIDASEYLLDHVKAIAVHTQIPHEDIQFVYSGNENDYDAHVLHHFVALDRPNKSIILAIRGTLSLSGAIVDVQGMASEFCSGKAHKGISEMANNLWNESGTKIQQLMDQYSDYKLIITGHSLGGGTSCLLNLKLHVEQIFAPSRKIECFAFAPPPTFFSCREDPTIQARVEKAIQNTVAYLHDNDVVPFLSIKAIRRMVTLLDAVDNETELIWFWRRWRMFYEYAPIPESIITSVLAVEQDMHRGKLLAEEVDGEHNMTIPARRVIWCKHNITENRFEAYSCDPEKIARGNIFLTPDMLSDHMPEMYEDALDAVLASINER
ncbi:unnamed protein product [Cylindrotheca closterium]|uniref:sn-1-specific diacylglycerol lipase n=1 Tax=Cylindrotheca closterium TaxID=2856 RepID=A0AAD2FPP0_9STRA|nr:unnamed protein product [Cylindrotheca closterium]